MAKHTFSTKELAHAFFHQHEFGIDYGKASSFSFEGNKLYSYSSILGIADFEKKIFKFRHGTYSSTTTQYQRNTRYAVPKDWKVFYWPTWSGFPDEPSYCDQFISTLESNRASLERGNKWFGGDMYEEVIKSLWDYCTTFNRMDLYNIYFEKFQKLKWTEEDKLKYTIKSWALTNGMLGSYDKKIKYYNDPILKALIEEKHSKDLSDKKAAQEHRKLERAKLEQEKLERWLKGEYSGGLYNVPIHLRIRKLNQGNVVQTENYTDPTCISFTYLIETTQGATVPMNHAKLLYKKFRQCIDTDTEWETNGHSFSIGNYKVSKIYKVLSKEGTEDIISYWYLQIGCHCIRSIEVEKFIEYNNLTDWRL